MSTTAAAPAPVRTGTNRLGLVFAGLMMVLLLAALDSTIVATALPTIVGDLGGLERIAWVTSAFLLAQTAVTPLYGKLGDQLGRKRVLQSAIVLFLAGSALCGLARTMTELIAFRAVQGLGAGGLIVLVQASVGDIVPPAERGRYQGLFGAVFGFAAVAGPLLGGVIVDNLSWQWIFYVNLPIGAIALVVISLTLPDVKARSRPAIDYLGAGVLAAGLSAIVLVASLGGTTWPWGSAQTVLVAVLGAVLLGLFVLVERRAKEPVLPLSLLRDDVFRVASLLSLIVGFALFGTITFLPLFFQTVFHASPTSAGLRLIPLIGRPRARIGHLRAADRHHRPLPPLSDRRHRGPDRRPVAALPDQPRHQRARDRRRAGRRRARARHRRCRCSCWRSRTRSPTRCWAQRPRASRSRAASAARSGRRCSGRSSRPACAHSWRGCSTARSPAGRRRRAPDRRTGPAASGAPRASPTRTRT